MGEQIQMLKRELSTDIYKELYYAFQQRDADKLESLLATHLDIDLSHKYGKPDYGTILDICAMQGECSKLIKILLKYDANPNIINPIRKKGAIHFASEKDDIESLRILLQCPKTDINLLDNTGSTALHYVTKLADPEMIALKLLLKYKPDVNLMNRKGKTALHIAIECLNKEAAIALIAAGTDLSIIGPSDITLKQEITETFPNINTEIFENQNINSVKKPEITHGQLFTLLRAQRYDEFIKEIKTNNHLIELNDGCHTFLQYCCQFGHANIVEELLTNGANPNTTSPTLRQTPLMLAGQAGNAKIIELLLRRQENLDFTPVDGETPLHCIVNSIQNSTPLDSDYLECLNMLLTKVPKSKLNINQQDLKGNTVLHYAAKLRQHKIVFRLLQNGAYIGVKNIMEEMACADISYNTFLEYLDSCISTNEALPREDNYEIIFNYECLLPAKTTQFQENSINTDIESNMGKNRSTQSETLPLLHIARNRELRPLLKHPIFTSFLHLKWHRIRLYFYINLIFYLLFWIFLTTYILQIYGNKNLNMPTSDNSTSISSDNIEVTYDFSTVGIIVTLLVIILFLRELFQLCLSPTKYLFNPENWLEIGIIIVTLTMLFSKSSINLKHQISAIGIMLSWAELVLLIGRHPALSTNIEMLKTVSYNFLKFLAWYSILIIAFALSFYSLFRDSIIEEENFFEDPGSSIFKTVVMLTGEFDAGTIPFVEHPITSHVLFVLFVFLIAIVLFNLLNGLAVSDTQAIRSDAELVSVISRAKLISYLETTLANPSSLVETLTKCFINSHKPIYTSLNLSETLLADYTARVRVNMGCTLTIESIGRKKKDERRHNDSVYKCDPCPQISMRISMDPTIVERAKQVLMKISERQSMKLAKDMEEEKERLLRQELENFRHSINNLTEMFLENRNMLDNISKALAVQNLAE